MNAKTHNFKIEHGTAFKLGKHKVERLINCLNTKMETENLNFFMSIGPLKKRYGVREKGTETSHRKTIY